MIDRQPESILARLREKLAEGGCGAVICNTVGRAQELYQVIHDLGGLTMKI